jgi:nicotinate-nucleotide pyrophosphorylase (carboxylating)
MRPKMQEYIREDIGSGDITSELVVPADALAKGSVLCKQDCVLAGCREAAEVFESLGAEAKALKEDGSKVAKGEVVLIVSGPARAVLAGERLALNFIMRMSGIATLTDDLVTRCRRVNPKVRVAATRKTTPGFREFEKRAVVLGGGDPHRSSLADGILIKDNHIAIAGGVREALRRARSASFTRKVEIEVEDERSALEAVEAGADIVMLDNFAPEQAKQLTAKLKAKKPSVLIEVSGGITPDNVEEYAAAADIISLGWLTHSVRSADFSMSVEPR